MVPLFLLFLFIVVSFSWDIDGLAVWKGIMSWRLLIMKVLFLGSSLLLQTNVMLKNS